jgi:hypothetical protein
MIIRPPAIEADSQLQKRLCRRGLRASVVQRVHLEGYLALGLKVLSFNYSDQESFV